MNVRDLLLRVSGELPSLEADIPAAIQVLSWSSQRTILPSSEGCHDDALQHKPCATRAVPVPNGHAGILKEGRGTIVSSRVIRL